MKKRTALRTLTPGVRQPCKVAWVIWGSLPSPFNKDHQKSLTITTPALPHPPTAPTTPPAFPRPFPPSEKKQLSKTLFLTHLESDGKLLTGLWSWEKWGSLLLGALNLAEGPACKARQDRGGSLKRRRPPAPAGRAPGRGRDRPPLPAGASVECAPLLCVHDQRHAARRTVTRLHRVTRSPLPELKPWLCAPAVSCESPTKAADLHLTDAPSVGGGWEGFFFFFSF